eukprot:gene1819-2940_t
MLDVTQDPTQIDAGFDGSTDFNRFIKFLGKHKWNTLSYGFLENRTVVVIIIDDLGFADLGFTGSAVRTPHLDSLATGGVRLSNYYVQRACSPTRAALLTGRYNIRYGMQSGVLETSQPFGLDLAETLLPQALRQAAEARTAASNCSRPPLQGWDCHGAGIPGFTPARGPNATSEPAACCTLCSSVEACSVWTVYKGGCYLKTDKCTLE